MAKKSTRPTDQPTASPAPRRRAPAKKRQAAAPLDIASLTATEPPASAPDTGADVLDSDDGPSFDEIAEAAYYRHLSRGGRTGSEFEDWIEAERELRQRRRR
jgi:hypothetical protein